mgnify:CR=1 FL=1
MLHFVLHTLSLYSVLPPLHDVHSTTYFLQAHRRTVTLEQQHMEKEDDDITEMLAISSSASDRALARPQTPPNVHKATLRTLDEAHSFSPSSSATLPRRRYSFLQHFAADPAYRPSFKSKWYLSLLGAVMCIFLMFKIIIFI